MSALEGLKNSIRRWGGSDDDESYSNELESAKEEPVQVFLHAARHRLQTQIRYTLIMQAQLCTLL